MMKIQNSIFIFFVVIFTLFADSVWSAEWIYFASSAARDSYYDRSSIQKVDDNIMSVRTKQVLNAKANTKPFPGLKGINKSPDNLNLISYILKSSEIDCLNNKIKDSSKFFYDERSSLVYSSPKGEISKWDDIISDSVGDKLRNIICGDTALSHRAGDLKEEKPAVTEGTVVASLDNNDKKQDQVDIKQDERKSLPEENVRIAVDKWLNSWRSGDMETYRSCYDESFESRKMKLNEWIAYKTNVRNKSKDINILIDDLKISTNGDKATAVFTQTYSSSILKDKGKKTLELKKVGNEWKIFREMM
jgi:hypothetical protein